MQTDLGRFVDCMEYRSSDRRPNHELGVWPQTRQRWDAEAPGTVGEFTWNWFYNEPALGIDRRDYIRVNYGFIPPFPREVLEDTPEYEVIRNGNGIVTKALKAGMIGDARMCMDQYLSFPVARPEDFPAVKARLVAGVPERYPRTSAGSWPPGAGGNVRSCSERTAPPTASTGAPASSWAPKRSLMPGTTTPISCTR